MARWLIYLKERFPALTYVLLVSGICLSGIAAAGGVLGDSAVLGPFSMGFAGLMLFFAELRLMDELKDYDKDVIAHPDRPLPRELIGRGEARRVVYGLMALLLAWAGFSVAVAGPRAGACFLLVAVWLWLMYREFYVGAALAKRPLLYAVLHQIILLPVAAYPALCAATDPAVLPNVLWLGVTILGAFFAYEVCRKLNPQAHPVLGTYLRVYGPAKTALLVLVTCGVAALGAHHMGLGALLWPFEAILILGLALLWLRPDQYKLVEGLATLSLLFHLWGAAIGRLFGVLL